MKKTESPSIPAEQQNPVVVAPSVEMKVVKLEGSPMLDIAVVLSNTLMLHHDEKAIELCLMHTKDLNPNTIIFNGDILDFYRRSEIDRNPLRIFSDREVLAMRKEIIAKLKKDEAARERADKKANAKTKKLTPNQIEHIVGSKSLERALGEELKVCFSVLKRFRKAHPKAELIWVYGCQEHYLVSYLKKYFPGLLNQLDEFCKENAIQKVYNGTRNNIYQYGSLVIGHWYRGGIDSQSGSVAHMLMDQEGVSLIQGHTKRGGWVCRTIPGEKPKFISAFENFSLCKRPVGKNWQLGYSVVYREKDKKRFQVFQVPIAKYGFFWGDKEYRLDPTKVGSWEKAIAISDIHFRFEDKEALAAVLGFMKEYQPDRVFLNGDLPDFPDISRFANSPLDILTDEDLTNLSSLVLESKQQGKIKKYLKPRLQRDFERIYGFFKELRQLCPKAEITWVFGNHDYRLQAYIDENAGQLAGVRRPGDKEEILALSELTRASEFGIGIVYSGLIESSTNYGDLLVGHFYKVSTKSSFTARNLVQQKLKSLIQPHVHRMGAYYKTLLDGTVLVGVEMGCLCRLDPHYTQNPNWQHGFVVIHKKKNSGRFYLQPVQIVDGAFLFGGKRYGRPSSVNNTDNTNNVSEAKS